MSTLYYGDNLDILKRYFEKESVDLIYLDPPFNSNASYNVLFEDKKGEKSAAQLEAFKDTWSWPEAALTFQELSHDAGPMGDALRAFGVLLPRGGMLAYLTMMAPRLQALCKVLKPTGSIYLHCDPTASHYLKVLMDAIFGVKNFRNEIIWKRTSARSDSHRWNHIHDSILFYTKSDIYTWHMQHIAYDPAYTDAFYHFVEEGTGRRYASDNLTAAGTREGSSGDTWRGIDVRSKGLHWKYQTEKLDELDRQGRILWPKKQGGVPRYKRYLDEMPGLAIQSMITDIPPLSAHSAEKLGYPTQKPEALLERIIRASSNEGDTVLDPFCGCGTAIAVAQRLNRNWIGIDITQAAIQTIKARLGPEVVYKVVGEPVSLHDAQQLADSDPYQFQWWSLGLVGARPDQQKKGPDKGIDGRLYFHDGKEDQLIILSVKAGHHVSADMVDALLGVVEQNKAKLGVLITMQPPTKPMRARAAEAGFYTSQWGKHPKIQLLTVAELMDGKKIDYPNVTGANVTFKSAPKARGKKAAQPTLPDDE